MFHRKYLSIENHYRQKFIDKFIYEYPELKHVEFILMEKIHGSHTMLCFEPDGTFNICSRNRMLKPDDKHYDIRELLDNDCENLINAFRTYAINTNDRIVLHGEIFGPGIQKGVNYGNKKQYRIFDLRIGEYLVAPCKMLDIFRFLSVSRYLVPIVAIVNGFETALNWDTRFNSLIMDIDDNECEGVVIKPYRKIYIHSCGAIFYLKKKNEAFREKSHKPKQPKTSKVVDPIVCRLREEFLTYINDNRLQSVFSKEGIIENSQDIGRYIGFVMCDARKDFMADFSSRVGEMDKKVLKQIFNPGAAIVAKLLQKHL